MFENRLLRRIFGPKGDEVGGGWRKLHNEDLSDLFSPNIFRVIKTRIMRCAEHVAHMGGRTSVNRVSVGTPGERDHL